MTWKTLRQNRHYKINEKGEVFSTNCGRILSPKKNHDGYLRIQLWSHSKCKFVSIHRLVAEEFIDNPDNKPFVNHIDGNKGNNSVNNLEWCTQKENIRHSWENGLSKSHLNKNGKTVYQYTLTGKLIRTFPSTMEVERETGIWHSRLSKAMTSKKPYKGFLWRRCIQYENNS